MDGTSGQVLTLAYMNKESLEISIQEERTCFWSRSRQELWRKGETSGNAQHIIDITADCDYDALVVRVNKDGPACHTGAESCFHNPIFESDENSAFSLEGLMDMLQGRKDTPKEGSYTSYLFDKGLDKILKKSARSLPRSSSPARPRTKRRRSTRSPTWPTTSWSSCSSWASPWTMCARS